MGLVYSWVAHLGDVLFGPAANFAVALPAQLCLTKQNDGEG